MVAHSPGRNGTVFHPVTRANPCPVCEGGHKCSVGEDGVIFCGRRAGPQPGFVDMGKAPKDEQYTIYRREGDRVLADRDRERDSTRPLAQPTDWEARARHFAQALTAERAEELAAALGLPAAALDALPLIGWTGAPKVGPCWTFPEVDATGKVVGIGRRFQDATTPKKAMSGCSRGLTLPNGWREHGGPVLVVEGPSDVLALTCCGQCAIGRPSNTGGVAYLAELLRDLPADRQVIVLGEWDQKPDGTWPGRDGGVKVSAELSRRLSRPVPWALPPDSCKDARAWVVAQQLQAGCLDEWHAAGELFLAGLVRVEEKAAVPRPKRALADVVRLADLKGLGAALKWYWPCWIMEGALTLVSADAGTGKTRLLADLVRRIRHGLPWPDGQPMTLPADTPVVWVPADNIYAQLDQLHEDFGLGELTYISAYRDDPFASVSLDNPECLNDLAELIELTGARIVIVDTLGNATDADLCRQEEAKRLAVPLMQMATRLRIALILLYHNSKEGKPLGRRIVERCRTVLNMTKTLAGIELAVTKTFDVTPAALAVQMNKSAAEYTTAGPGAAPQVNPAVQAAADWIRKALATGPQAVSTLQAAAAAAGIGKHHFFDGRAHVLGKGEVVQYGTRPKMLSLTAWDEEQPIPD